MKRWLLCIAFLTFLSGCVVSNLQVLETKPEQEPMPPKIQHVTFTAGGDVLIHNTVYQSLKTENGYDFTPSFAYFTDVFKADVNIVNVESPIDAYGNNKALANYPTFNAPFELSAGLREMGATVAITANNHCMDNGINGLFASLRNLRNAGFFTMGTYESPEDYAAPKILQVNGVNIGLLAYTDSTNGIPVPASAKDYAVRLLPVNEESARIILADVALLKEQGADTIILSYHWGAEYKDAPAEAQRTMAKTLLEGGVDVLIGSHSHCVQPMEWIETTRGKRLAAYSLGNLFADQVGLNRLKTQAGMLLHFTITIEGEELRVEEVAYTPTFTYRNSTKKGPGRFLLLKSGSLSREETRPELFANNTDWQQCKNALAHVKTILGDEFEERI